jgi:putative ABC transport system permease protein
LVDATLWSFGAVRAQRTRSFLTALGIAIGIAAVTLLTSFGEGLHRFVLAEFTQFGTNLIAVTPGTRSTFGVSGAVVNTVRPLTLEDAQALARVRHVDAIAPMVTGNAAVEWQGRTRRAAIYGVGARMPEVWRFDVAAGTFLPRDEQGAPRAFAVLGSKLERELFGDANPLGEVIRIGGNRYRVVGVMRPKGQFLGFDLDDAVFVPTARGLELFDREGVMEIDVLMTPNGDTDTVVEDIRRVLVARHGREDFTIIPQQQMLDVLGSVLGVLTFAVGALGGISLLVGAVGILAIMTIAIRERTGEIGLLRALGATQGQVLAMFLLEAAALAATGGLAGLVVGLSIASLLAALVPALPVHPSVPFAIAAEGVAIGVGLLAGVAPAVRAARLDPVEALRAE